MEPLHPDTEGRPVYLRVADAVTRSILSGEFPPGARLPGRNFVAARYGVAGMTVTNAYAELARRGVVAARKGAGTVVTAEALVRLQGTHVDGLRGEVTKLTQVVNHLTQQVDQLTRQHEQLRAALAEITRVDPLPRQRKRP